MSQVDQSSIDYVGQKSRSFYWPLRLLPDDQAQAIADLYRFCRIADDWADEGESEAAKNYLMTVAAELENETPQHPEVEQALRLVHDWGVPKDALLYLLQALLEDIGPRQIKDEGELIRFCYGVAGVIGLMLCPLLRVRSEKAKAHAIDLGIAMQLSNVARDVLEDARRDRIYLPATWLPEINGPQQLIEASAANGAQIQAGVSRLLALAERYYVSAMNGYCGIPFRSRVPIRLAGAFYREVGRCVHPDVNRVSPLPRSPRRLHLGAVLVQSLIVPVPRGERHIDSLHAHLAGLPGVQSSLL